MGTEMIAVVAAVVAAEHYEENEGCVGFGFGAVL